ncbi:MAG: COX15/CtaA family protein [Chloroflexi bacterium]|nr:COX15/CtaA family protein [Chloroflexota bacterium]MCY4247106.1 COX15/CtaA family protein [Chloroflexota bacterium]
MASSVAAPSRSPSFVWCALGTAALTWALIVFGAVVRVTDSGLGCGTDWPLCNGTVFPPLDNLTAWIEWLHRLFALLIGLCGLATLALAWRDFRKQDARVLRLAMLAAFFFLLQSGLGAVVVFWELPPTFVTLHLGVAMLLLAALLAAALVAWHHPQPRRPGDSLSELAGVNAAFALLIILTGALVRGSGATLACVEWPLCYAGILLPVEEGLLAVIHMTHRFSVAAMAVTLLFLAWRSWRRRALVRRMAMAAALVYLLQIGVGGLFVISAAGPVWGAVHVGLAAAVWGLLVCLFVIERLALRARRPIEKSMA